VGRIADDFADIARRQRALREPAPSARAQALDDLLAGTGVHKLEPPVGVEDLCPFCYGVIYGINASRPLDCTGACQGV
jgi:hypothetical protein